MFSSIGDTTEPIAATAFADAAHVNPNFLWYRLKQREVVGPYRHVVLVRRRGNPDVEVVSKRRDVENVLGLLGGDRLALDPAHVPQEWEVFLHASPSRKKIAAGIHVVTCDPAVIGCSRVQLPVATGDNASLLRGGTRKRKRNRDSDTAPLSHPSVAEADGTEFLLAPPEAAASRAPQQQWIEMERLRLFSQRSALPLASFGEFGPDRLLQRVAGLRETWYRHTPAAVSSDFRAAAPSSRLAAFSASLLWTENAIESCFRPVEIVQSPVIRRLATIHQLGYKLVLFATFPFLHHERNAKIVSATLRCLECIASLGEVPLTIIVSVASYFSTSAFPSKEFWDCFVKHHNGGVRPSPTLSFLVGRHDGSPPDVLSIDKDFALLMNLPFFSEAAFLRDELPCLQ